MRECGGDKSMILQSVKSWVVDLNVDNGYNLTKSLQNIKDNTQLNPKSTETVVVIVDVKT